MKNIMPSKAVDYDKEILQNISFYKEILNQTINLINTVKSNNFSWLDTGCGTGELINVAKEEFPLCKFTLCDPSQEMLDVAREKLAAYICAENFLCIPSQNITFENEFDVITAILCHHYLDEDTRKKAVERCYKSLKSTGIYIMFENFAPNDLICKEITLKRWGECQKRNGKIPEAVTKHLDRYNKDYFPISLNAHLDLLNKCGFKHIQVFWLSYMQIGIYAIK